MSFVCLKSRKQLAKVIRTGCFNKEAKWGESSVVEMTKPKPMLKL